MTSTSVKPLFLFIHILYQKNGPKESNAKFKNSKFLIVVAAARGMNLRTPIIDFPYVLALLPEFFCYKKNPG